MRNKRQILLLSLTLVLTGASLSFGQDILTASAFFNQVADRYAQVNDYSANIALSVDDQQMSGHLFWVKRSRLRIDFNSPAEQVIISDGLQLQVYIPRYNVTLTQKLDPSVNTANLATGEGLTLLKRGYNVAFKSGPQATALDEGGSEMVTKLVLTWKNSNQGYRQIDLAIGANKYIRRIEGVTADRRKIRIDFYSMYVNSGIPDITFKFNTPPESNRFDNFLFGNTN